MACGAISLIKQTLKLTSPIPASVNHYMATRAIVKNGRPMAMMYETKEAKDYKKFFKEYVRKEAKAQGWIMGDDKFQKYYVDAVWYFPRTDMDAQNYWKLLSDAITESESVWIDDVQVCERTQAILYDSENPRVELIIYPVNFIGIFNDEGDLLRFEVNCLNCKRFTKNCSILKKAKEGRIQPEIEGRVCSKFKEK